MHICYNIGMKRRFLIVGGTGLVGASLVRAWSGTGVEVRGTSRRDLDMSDPKARARVLGEFKPEVVAIPAANPFVDYCELHPVETRRVNVDATIALAQDAAGIGARSVFYSSDYAFDGVQGTYTEEDAPSPINEYGRQKVAAEAGVLAADPRNLVLRTSGVYGWQLEPKNFVLQVRTKLTRGETMKVAGDLRYNPTFAEDLAAATVALVETGARGIFHAAGAETISRYDFAVAAARVFGLDPSGLTSVSSAELSFPTPRPKQSVLLGAKLAAAIGPVMGGARDGLARMAAGETAWLAFRQAIC